MPATNATCAAWGRLDDDGRSLWGSNLIQHCVPHLHDTYTVAYLHAGSARVSVGGGSYEWRAGTFLLINPFEVHSGVASTLLEYDVLYPSEAIVAELARRRAREAPRFAARIVDAGPRNRVHQPRTAAQIESALRALLLASPRLLDGNPAESRIESFVAVACDQLRDRVGTHVDLAMLTSQFDCSREHFLRTFHRVTGLSPTAYLLQLRLSRARAKLADGESIADAALDAGFADQAHLTRTFKRFYGTTPGKLRRDLQSFGGTTP